VFSLVASLSLLVSSLALVGLRVAQVADELGVTLHHHTDTEKRTMSATGAARDKEGQAGEGRERGSNWNEGVGEVDVEERHATGDELTRRWW